MSLWLGATGETMKFRHFLLPILVGLATPALAAGGAGSNQASQPGTQIAATFSLYAG
jgi:hypothetical protein